MLVMIDNFDSFTYNLYQYLMQMGAEVRVARNNHLTLEELEALGPRGLVISPGPGEMTMRSGNRARTSPAESWSLRTTRVSAPSSPRYW